MLGCCTYSTAVLYNLVPQWCELIDQRVHTSQLSALSTCSRLYPCVHLLHQIICHTKTQWCELIGQRVHTSQLSAMKIVILLVLPGNRSYTHNYSSSGDTLWPIIISSHHYGTRFQYSRRSDEAHYKFTRTTGDTCCMAHQVASWGQKRHILGAHPQV